MKRIVMLAACLMLMVTALSACRSKEPAGTSTQAETAESKELLSSQAETEPAATEPQTTEAPTAPAEPVTVITGGASQSEAQMLDLGVRYTGTYRESEIWVAFTTGAGEEVPYTVTTDNLTAGSKDLYVYLYDANGEKIKPTSRDNDDYYNAICQAGENGKAGSGMVNTLAPNTAYYLQIVGGNKADFSLVISTPEAPIPDAERTAVSSIERLPVTTNMDAAALLEAGVRYNGKYEEGTHWFAFTTGSGEDVPYTVTLTDLTPGSGDMYAYLYDAAGYKITPVSRDNNDYYRAICLAEQYGKASSGMVNTLEPDSTYFLRVYGKGKEEFSIVVSTPEAPIPDAVHETANAEERLPVTTNMDAAALLEAGVRYNGKYEEGTHWFAFKTGSGEDVPYTVTLTDLTPGSGDIYAYLYDAAGYKISPVSRDNNDYYRAICLAVQDGKASSGMVNTLEPDSTYFLQVYGHGKEEFSIVVSTPEAPIPDTERQAADAAELLPETTCMDTAVRLTQNTTYKGKYENGYRWFAFTIGSEEDAPYTVTVENTTVGSGDLYAYVYNIAGGKIIPVSRDNNDYHKAFCIARQDGKASSGMVNTLDPDTTYFIRLSGNGKAEFLVTVTGPESGGEPVTGEEGVEDNIKDSVLQDETVEAGTSQSYAMDVPLNTKVYGKYTGGSAWLAFTTTDVEDEEYYITIVNCTAGSNDLYAHVHDVNGNKVIPTTRDNNDYSKAFCVSDSDGTANTGRSNALKPNTKYYVWIQGNGKIEYSFRVSTPGSKKDGIQTSSNLAETEQGLGEDDVFYTGTNQNAATLLQTNVRYRGRYESGYCWVSFTTGPEEDAPYTISLENLTVDSKDLYAYLFDEFGYKQRAVTRDNSDYYQAICLARQDGKVSSGMIDTLKPDTTYYIRIQGGSKADYILSINVPVKEGGNTIQEDEIFGKPFEINETQVRFVANKAEFLHPEEAREILAPVAEKILANPGRPILLAGTTAQFGGQEGCAALSRLRAEAVKEMLVTEFGVPEEQLITAGLGYEDDPFVRGQDWDANGRFVETEAAKNRRVVVLSAESATGRQILGE
ncbi:MAG: OmpA family protein [Lachnospiraceae bacterium]|nr:OmpA family protein [Lachnospiraceae bacterium]